MAMTNEISVKTKILIEIRLPDFVISGFLKIVNSFQENARDTMIITTCMDSIIQPQY